MRIAVLLASFNRRVHTLTCLERLYRQRLPDGCTFQVFLTDDASTDDTAAAVREHFPGVHVLQGTGSLFWAGGMRRSWREALSLDYDYYLLLNDDTLLATDALATLLSCQLPGIVIGATADDRGRLSYGGRQLTGVFQKGWFRRWKSSVVHSDRYFIGCDLGNANIMLVPRDVVREIGILSDRYTHLLADYDYCLRAGRAGFPVRVAPGFLGSCVDDHGRNWLSAGTSFARRLAYLRSPKGLAYREYLYFIRRHFPLSLPSSFVKLWAKTLLPGIWDRLKKPVNL